MTDRFQKYSDSASSPARDAYAVQPDDTLALPIIPKTILVGQGGVTVLQAI